MMFKHILKEASSPAVVHFINGLFDKNYKPNSRVAFLPNESVSELSRMHGEIYGNYNEFKEVNMTLMQKVKTHHKEFEKRGEKRGKRLGAIEVLNLVKQGYKPSEIEKMVLT
jgi:hypothetical protein